MSKFGDLLGKQDKPTDLSPHGEETGKLSVKENAFANLKKTVAVTSPLATVGEGVNPPRQKTPSPKPFAGMFDLKKKEERKTVEPIPPVEQPETGAVDTLQELTAPTFSEDKAAKEFQSPDQPEEYSDIHVAELKNALEILKNSIGNKELITDALKNIMLYVKQHVFLKDILLPEDCQLMTRSLRESYGVTIVKKQVKKTKKAATAADVDEVMDLLDSVDIQI